MPTEVMQCHSSFTIILYYKLLLDYESIFDHILGAEYFCVMSVHVLFWTW